MINPEYCTTIRTFLVFFLGVFTKMPLVQTQKMQLRDKGCKKKKTLFCSVAMAASLPRNRASGEPVGSISSRGSIGHQWAQTICQESSPPEIRAGWGESRARVPGSQPAVGVDASPVCPRDTSESAGLTAPARPLATSRAAARTIMQRFGCNTWSYVLWRPRFQGISF